MANILNLKFKHVVLAILGLLLISQCSSQELRFLQDDLVDEDVEDTGDLYQEEENIVAGPITTTLFETPTQIMQLEWWGSDYSSVIGLSQDGKIYRSNDKGINWENQSSKYTISGEKQNAINIVRMVMSPADKNLVFFLGSKGVNWLTEDCGSTVKELNHGTLIHDFVFHPTKREWALASVYTTCDDFDESEKCKIYNEVYLTKNLGVKWTFLQDYALQYEWAKKDKDDGIPEKRILMIKQGDQTSNQSPDEWSPKNTLIKSDDLFTSNKVILQGGNQFKLTKDYLYVAKMTSDNRKVLSTAKRTSDFSKFLDMQISQKGVHKFDFNIIEMNTGGVFLFLTRPDKNVQAGNMYVSDNEGTHFSVTLQALPYLTKHEFDFCEVQSLPGVYIANVYDRLDKMVEEEYEDFYAGTTNKRNKNAKKLPDRKSVITFNGGGDWKPITPPEKSAAGKRIKCDANQGWSLHLHNYSSAKYPYPYSVPSAVGLIIAVGNIGVRLSDNEYDLNTYLSRDGGLTWIEVIKGPHIAEYGDHGGIITLAPFKRAPYILYTSNEGISWEKVMLKKPVLISNIIIEPRSVSTKFTIIGAITHVMKDKQTKETGVLMSVDFSQLYEPNCQGIDKAGDDSSDYEIWSPSDGDLNSNGWFLGKKTKFIRKKRERKCINGEDIEKEIFVENCMCTKKDYEWDEGYKRTEDGDCEAIDSNITISAPEDCTDYYFVERGYRKIPGNTWEGGSEFERIKVMCPGQGFLSPKNMLYISVVLVLCYLFYQYVAENGVPGRNLISKMGSKDDSKGRYEQPKSKENKNDNNSDDEDAPIEMGGIKSGFTYNDEENAEAIDIRNFNRNEPTKRTTGSLLD